jgi:hypothetical protein
MRFIGLAGHRISFPFVQSNLLPDESRLAY